MKIHPIILCGGSGSRLWPASRSKYPKQFMDLGEGRTLFKDTLLRINFLSERESPIIVSNNDYRFYVNENLKSIESKSDILLEPASRNTAPAITLAALDVLEKGDNLMLVLPSDHQIQSSENFCKAVELAKEKAEDGFFITFGITPDYPETGYGYIKKGKNISNNIYEVIKFIEKPDKKNAKEMLTDGRYFWNSGIFFFKASTYLKELNKFAPDILSIVKKSWDNRTTDLGFIRPSNHFKECKDISIDYALMEHTDKTILVPTNCGWSDLGSWEAFYNISKKDSSNNVCDGDIIIDNSSNCYFKSSGRLIAAIDVEDIALIETNDAILVSNIHKTQNVKNIVEKLKNSNRKEIYTHLKNYRPWGSYESLAISNRFQVKRIIVNPKQEISLQIHYHRSEHWVIVNGTAEVTLENKVYLLTENESIYIPIGKKHRIKNVGRIPLIFIEVQSGSYLGEDDIVRLQDNYGRANKEE